MKKRTDPLKQFEQLTVHLAGDLPPPVRVIPQALRRIRAAEAATERTLAVLAAGSFVAAAVVALVGFSFLSQLSDPMESIFQIVPPIGL